jgi:hypothetical protein
MANSFSLSTAGSLPQGIAAKANNAQAGLLSGIGHAASSLWGGVKELAEKGSFESGVNNAHQSIGQPAPYKAPAVTPGLIPSPTTPVKSVTHNAVDGSSTTTAFHAPAVTAGKNIPANANGLSDTQINQGYSTIPGQYDPVTGQLKSNGNATSGATAVPTAATPAPLTTAGQVPGLLQSGKQTGNEHVTQQRLIDLSNNPSQAYQDAQSKYQLAVQNLSNLKQNLAKYTQGIEAQGIPLAGITGQEANLSKSAAAQLDAAQQAVTEAEQGLSYANTQQGLQETAGQGAYSGAQTQAQRATGAAGTAVQAVAPITGVQYGTQTIQPGTLGTTSGAGTVQPSDPFYATLQQYAKMAASGQLASVPSSVTGNAQLNAQLNDMAKQINPSYNPIVSSTQGNITSSQVTQQATYQSALQQGQALQSQLTDLIRTFGLNPSDINAANTGLQKIAQNTSSPQYKILQNYVNDVANTYAQILTPPGGSATDTTRSIAASMIDATASGQSMITTMQSLDQAAQAKIANVVTPTSSASSGGSTPTSFAEKWF